MKKKKVGLIFGGKSTEHEVSLQSAKNIIEAMDKTKYDVFLIGIDKKGRWHIKNNLKFLLNSSNPALLEFEKNKREVAIVPGENKNQILNLDTQEYFDQLDVIFPIIHGTFGEDGSLQGMLRMANIPFVGSSVLGSAISMDKDTSKRLLKAAGFNVAKSYTFTQANKNEINFEEIASVLGLPLFIKPSNQGSSVGVNKVYTKLEFETGIEEAFKFDHKILIEEEIVGREIECSILGNDYPIASLPGEVISKGDFYSYHAKYIDENGAILEIPAKLNNNRITKIQELAIKAFQTLNCEGLARVDFFLRKDDSVVINEVNTIPGFTKRSMYPKLWEASGISYSQLIDKLIELAIERHHRDSGFKKSLN
ncbi:D-alanine--D-alanine ligase [Compostibacillus humi]|uniref:D-alanine--D-alanine ligase n=1 Tax=Compostibacillus humi TaxID=1245525 RepID=A0A8J2TSC0_9BACI|nr:D-alanine--D-alanine ligase [Compostibacillus humi]GFZ92274.1 D-alanine--D-alanine ligase [Compostibacillus humi]